MPGLRRNVVTKPYMFHVWFKDGREEDITVMAESYHSAVYSLPSGKKHYEHITNRKGKTESDG